MSFNHFPEHPLKKFLAQALRILLFDIKYPITQLVKYPISNIHYPITQNVREYPSWCKYDKDSAAILTGCLTTQCIIEIHQSFNVNFERIKCLTYIEIDLAQWILERATNKLDSFKHNFTFWCRTQWLFISHSLCRKNHVCQHSRKIGKIYTKDTIF